MNTATKSAIKTSISALFAAGLWAAVAVTPAAGAALMHIQGKLVSYTHEHYLILRNHTIYYIKRDALSGEQVKKLEKTGETVEVVVPPSAIELVKAAKESDG